ncbi:nucleic-acid-binding protein from mobile element jockey [Lasius niger]|uniref:Nucleic-acid-binding protein from mobile element jockey n=1 Tax=Lasius niger TaxID=67767 RepID=A0A0J7JYJ1_LASNI|nr:nucleic-acid-binding protein from mobile element jockey [Lasius niger]
MTPYIPNIRQCFNCGQLNHVTKFCRNNAKCLVCGLDKHSDDNSCSNKMNCINCGGNHRTLSKNCPDIIIKRKTAELMATQNMDYNNVKKLIMLSTPITGAGSVRSWNNPSLSRLNGTDFCLLSNNSAYP